MEIQNKNTFYITKDLGEAQQFIKAANGIINVFYIIFLCTQ